MVVQVQSSKHPDPPNGNLALGRAVHWALTQNFAQKIETYEDLPLSGVLALFREAWALERDQAEFRDDEDPSQLAFAGEALVMKYLDEVAPTIEPAAVELHVEGEIGGVRVQGFIDVLDVDGRIIDIKTAKASPSGIEPMHRFQIATYRQLAPAASGKGRIDTLVKTKTPKIVLQSFDITEDDLRATQTIYAQGQPGHAVGTSTCPTACRCFAPAATAPIGGSANASGAARFPRHEASAKPSLPGLDSNPSVRRLRIDPWIEASHTGPHGLGQKSSDYSAIPLCANHHRTGKDSYHKLGPRRFSEVHNLDIRAIVFRLNMKPQVRLEAGWFVAHLEGERYVLGKISNGLPPAIRRMREVCGRERMALGGPHEPEREDDRELQHAGARMAAGL